VRNNARTLGVNLTLRADFDVAKLSERELEQLRAFLPDLIRELIHLSQLDQDEE
jgi:hypothetical protein